MVGMRYDKTRKILELARALASSAEGLTLDEMCRAAGCERRTVERMRDTIREVFPQMEEIPDPRPSDFTSLKGSTDSFRTRRRRTERPRHRRGRAARRRRDGARPVACGA